MKSREELRNDYEEALFAMIMDDIMELEGEALLVERERLQNSDEYKVPDDVNERCAQFIYDAFDENKRIEKKRRARKVWRTIFIAALISCLGFSTAYASVPSVKSLTDNLIIKISKISAKLFYGGGEFNVENPYYVFAYIPEGFELIEEMTVQNQSLCNYVNKNSQLAIRGVFDNVNWESSVDVENADIIQEIFIEQYEGLLVSKENRIHVVVSDVTNKNVIEIVCEGVDQDTVLRIIEESKFIE